jgi:hypothetical protein
MSGSALFTWRHFEAEIILCAVTVVSALYVALPGRGRPLAGMRCVGGPCQHLARGPTVQSSSELPLRQRGIKPAHPRGIPLNSHHSGRSRMLVSNA